MNMNLNRDKSRVYGGNEEFLDLGLLADAMPLESSQIDSGITTIFSATFQSARENFWIVANSEQFTFSSTLSFCTFKQKTNSGVPKLKTGVQLFATDGVATILYGLIVKNNAATRYNQVACISARYGARSPAATQDSACIDEVLATCMGLTQDYTAVVLSVIHSLPNRSESTGRDIKTREDAMIRTDRLVNLETAGARNRGVHITAVHWVLSRIHKVMESVMIRSGRHNDISAEQQLKVTIL